MDEYQFEMAERLERAQRDAAINKASNSTAPEKHPDFDGANCISCEEPIPTARLQLGKVRCIECQTAKERHRA